MKIDGIIINMWSGFYLTGLDLSFFTGLLLLDLFRLSPKRQERDRHDVRHGDRQRQELIKRVLMI